MAKLDPGLDQPQLLARQLTSQDLAVFDADRSLELSILGVKVGQIVP